MYFPHSLSKVFFTDASKSLSKIISIYFQVANDHFRPKNDFGQPMYIPATNEKSHWYWLTRFQWAI